MKRILLIVLTMMLCDMARAEDTVMTDRSSRYKGQWYDSHISAAQLAKQPLWSPLTTDAAPLSASKAAQLAWKEFERIVPESERSGWRLTTIQLNVLSTDALPTGNEPKERKWYYAVHVFNTKGPTFADMEASRLKSEYFTILVLMDGETCQLFPVATEDKKPEPMNAPDSHPRPVEKRAVSPPGFPEEPPVKDADPQVRSNRTFQVPTRLIVGRTAERIEVSVDMNSLQTIELKVGHKMVTGFKHHTVILSGDQRKDGGGGLGGTANIGTSYINRALDGIPKPDEKYVIEVTFTLFETDIPGQHLWSPESGKYKELWTRTLKSEEF